MTNPLLRLGEYGQSVWLDYIRRSLIASGELARLVAEDGLRGVTSNPSIFEKAIDGSTDYDAEIARLSREGRTTDEILWELVVADIRAAADVLRPVFDATEGADGFVSIEVPPELADDTEGTVAEALRLWGVVDRPNLMIKVPGTLAGAPAIERLTARGVNVNVTLLFSLRQYERAATAYLRGGARTRSVASFFLSRIDSAVDPLLPPEARGRTAVANARLAYRRFGELFAGARQRQRLLWASTSTKNPEYSDVLYVEQLIGPDTVNTLPPGTIDAFRDHGHAARTLERDVGSATAHIGGLPGYGVDLDAVCERLQVEGVAAFRDAWTKLKAAIEAKAGGARGDDRRWLGSLSPGGAEQPLAAGLDAVRNQDVARRVWRRDVSLWGGRGGDALGWLIVPQTMEGHVEELARFDREVRADGFRDVFLLGMGGSSLCPDVLRRTFPAAPDHPRLTVLDTSDPATILAAARRVDLNRTLFLVSSKSGTTLEPDCLFRFFWDKIPSGDHFVAITDPGTPLDREAQERGFRHIFRNPADIGGRYSALSYFGLVPAALLGLDVSALLDRGLRMLHACDGSVTAAENPGAWLGAVMGGAARAGRNKVTLLAPSGVSAFPAWLEQLLAESTGKEGRGIVPVAGEPLGPPEAYGEDRLFVAFDLNGEGPDTAALARAGQPVCRLPLRDPLDLGAEFYRWEFATAVAGHLLGINAFDQPNVQEAKDRTAEVLDGGRLEMLEMQIAAQSPAGAGASGGQRLADFLAQARPGSYVAFMAYLPYTEANDHGLEALRVAVRDRLRVATTVGYGPRFLHSTGQLHKGGPDTGLFVQITADDAEDAAVPDRPFTFGMVKRAQAVGDYRALQSRGRPVLRLHLGAGGLEEVLAQWRAL